MKVIQLPKPELFKEMVTAIVFLMIGILGTHWYDKEAISKVISENNSTSCTCTSKLIGADSEINSCNKAHYALGYCVSSLATCESDKEFVVGEARKLYTALNELTSPPKNNGE